MWLFALFVAVPLVEIALFITVGGALGLVPTLAVVVLTAVAGSWLVRSQGRQVVARVRDSLDQLRDPTSDLAHGAMILVAGVLLLTPGFFTDILGFLLLVPGVRERLFRALVARIEVVSIKPDGGAAAGGRRDGPVVIDGDFVEVDAPATGGAAGRRPSP